MSYTQLVLGFKLHCTSSLSLFEGFFVTTQHFVGELGILITAGLCLLLYLGDTGIDGFEVFKLQLKIDNLFISNRVDAAIDVCDIIVVETTQHMQYGIGLADIGQELVTQPLAFACTFYKTCNIDNLHSCRHNTLWMN